VRRGRLRYLLIVKVRNDIFGKGSWPIVIGVLVAGVLASGLIFATGARAVDHAGAQSTALSVQAAAPTLGPGSRGPAVHKLQSDLARLTYLPYSGVDGVFGTQTWHAVVAFQGWSGLTRDGVVGPRTRNALSHARRPAPWSRAAGFEIHLAQQVLLLVRDGRVQRSIHVSTGAGGRTPLGHFHVHRREALSWSVQFHVWMPLAQYFYGGIAMHQFGSVPPYPASHGCVRVPGAEARTVWRFGAIGMRVWTRH
jgi:Putative peptidoglycan binding domain/L,D-transpeptidase catalytic domain